MRQPSATSVNYLLYLEYFQFGCKLQAPFAHVHHAPFSCSTSSYRRHNLVILKKLNFQQVAVVAIT